MLQRIRNLSDRSELLLVLAVCCSYSIGGSLFALASGIRRIDLTTGRALRQIAIELLLLLAGAAILRVRGWPWQRLGLQFSWKAAVAGVPLSMCFLFLYMGLASLALLLPPATRETWTFRVTMSAPVIVTLLFIVINAVFEETVVAAYVIAALSRYGAVVAVLASTLLRVAFHLYQGPLTSLSSLEMGLIFGAVFWRWRTVWPLVVAHTIANVMAYAGNPE